MDLVRISLLQEALWHKKGLEGRGEGEKRE
jgi:hypothetical protein